MVSPEGRRKGRPQNSWMQKLTTGLKEMKIRGMQWINRGDGEEKKKKLRHSRMCKIDPHK